MPNKWVEHIKEFAKLHNMSYGCALSDPDCKASYKNPSLKGKQQFYTTKLYKKQGKGFLDQLTKAGIKAGQPFDTAIGLNPFTLGYDIGHDIIAPELMKTFPKGKGMKKGKKYNKKGYGTDEIIGLSVGGGIILFLLLYVVKKFLSSNAENNEEIEIEPNILNVAQSAYIPFTQIINYAENLAHEVPVEQRRSMREHLSHIINRLRGNINRHRIAPISNATAVLNQEVLPQVEHIIQANVIGSIV